jgi:hypothetical protein
VLLNRCKGTYAWVWPPRHTYGNYCNTVANLDTSDIRCRCIGKIITRDLRFVASRLYTMAVPRPGSRATMTSSPSLGADLLGCISHIRDKEKHYSIMPHACSYKLKGPGAEWHCTVTFWCILSTGKLHLPLTSIWRW